MVGTPSPIYNITKKDIKGDLKMNKNTKIKVRNRCGGSLTYKLPDMNNFVRTFAKGETKELPFEEIQKLAYIPGGEYMLQHSLVIENLEAREEILGQVELEYDYDEKDIEKLLINGSMDQLLDCLDFAPKGVIDLVKQIAVKIELNDMRKREAIFKKTGFNVNNAIKINQESNETVEQEDAAAPARRVAQTAAAPAEGVRRTGGYTVTKK